MELLVVYGADPAAMDVQGKSPVETAREAGHADLAERLVEMAFELTGETNKRREEQKNKGERNKRTWAREGERERNAR